MLKQLIGQFDSTEAKGNLSNQEMDALRQLEEKQGKGTSKYGIQHVGKESFLIFKPEHVTTKQMMIYLHSVGRDLKRSGLTQDGVVRRSKICALSRRAIRSS